MRHILVNIILCCATLFGYFCSLSAQEVKMDTLWLDTFKVEAQKMSDVYPVDSIPSAIIADATSLVDALRASGNHYVREYGVGNIANISMRGGSAQHSALFWNGIPINSPGIGQTDLSLIPAIFIGEVAIYAGSSSQLSGSGGLGGSVLLNSTKKKRKKFSLHQSVVPTLAGFGTDASLDYHAGKWIGRTSIHALQAENGFTYINDSGRDEVREVRQNNAIDIQGLAQDISYQLSQRASISFNTYYIHAEREIPANIGLPDQENNQEDKIGRAAIRYQRISRRWRHTLLLGDSEEWQRYEAPLSFLDSRIRTRASNLRARSSYVLSEFTMLRAQLNYDILQLNLDNTTLKKSNIFGLFLEVEQKIRENTEVNFGVRINQVDGTERPLTASFGVQHFITKIEGLSFKASVSKNHRDPTLNDRYWPGLGDSELKSEGGYGSDISMHWETGVLQWAIGGFYSQLDELITWLPALDGRFRPVNVSESESSGIESTATIQPSDQFSLRAAYTYTDSRIIRRNGEQQQENIYQPQHRIQTALEFQSEQHRIGSVYSYSSPVRVDFLDQGSLLPSIHLWDISYRWTPGAMPEVSFGFDAKNLLNRNYEYVSNRPTAGRYLQFHIIITINEKP